MSDSSNRNTAVRLLVVLGFCLAILVGLFALFVIGEKRPGESEQAAVPGPQPDSAQMPSRTPTLPNKVPATPPVELAVASSVPTPIPSTPVPKVTPSAISRRNSDVPPPPPGPLANAGDSPLNDLFAPLRNRSPYPDDHWTALDEAFRHIARVDGAHYDKATGRLILVGPYTQEPGPYRLEDWCVALWGSHLGDGQLGMTIDPPERNKLTAPMDVKFFGETRDTRLGQRMYECDWLLKGLSLGVESIAPASKRSQIKDFRTYVDLAQSIGGNARQTWSRFWLALMDEDKDATKSTLRVQMSQDQDTIFLAPPRLYACTATMLEDAQGRLRSGDGSQDLAAKAFVRHFNAHFDEFLAHFSEMNQLRELSRLVLVARWVRDHQVPFDYELLYLRFEGASVATPLTALVQKAESERAQVSGGVNFRAPKLDASPDRTNALLLEREIKALASQLPSHGGFTARSESRASDRQYVIIGPTTPGPSQGSATQKRRPKKAVVESDGKMRLTNAPPPQLFADFDAIVDPSIPNLAVMRSGFLNGKPVEMKQYKVTVNGRLTKRTDLALIPDFMYLTSPRGDINVRFGEMEYRPESNEVYFKCDVPGVSGYYPETGQVRFENGGWVGFNKDSGIVESVKTPNGPVLDVVFDLPHDGPLRISDPARGTVRNRGPPKLGEPPNPRRSQIPIRDGPAEMKLTATPVDVTKWMTFTDRASHAQVTVARVAGEIATVEIPSSR